MKKLIAVALISLGLSSSAFAFNVRANIQLNGQLVQATVSNVWGQRMVCSGQAIGVTSSGARANAWMRQVVIYPGQNAYVYVRTNPYQTGPFVNGWANIDCRWF